MNIGVLTLCNIYYNKLTVVEETSNESATQTVLLKIVQVFNVVDSSIMTTRSRKSSFMQQHLVWEIGT